MAQVSEEQLDYLWKVLAHPELEDSDTFRTWLQDAGNRQLYLDAKAAHDGLGLQEHPLPDTQAEWEAFCRRAGISTPPRKVSLNPDYNQLAQTAHRPAWRIWQVAASLLLLVGLGWGGYAGYRAWTAAPRPVALMESQPLPLDVTLSTSNGHRLALSGNTDRDSLRRLGTALADPQKITYKTYPQAETIAYHVLTTPRGKDFKISLHDGTEVWLNAESSLRYPARFNGQQRVVELSGEAYFQVAQDAERPFVVKTDRMQTEVLGTSFNFRSYAHSTPHVTLVEGRVVVTGNNTTVTLHPDEDVRLEADGTLHIQQVDTRNYTAWTKGYFYFEDTRLDDIMRELGRWYNLTIRFNNARAMGYHFTFWGKRNAPAEENLRLINELGKVRASLNGHVLTID